MLVGISYYLQAQPGPSLDLKMNFIFQYGTEEVTLRFPYFKSLTPDTAKIQSIAAQDLSRRFMLVASSPYPNLHYAFTGYNIHSRKYIHELYIEWNNESTTIDLFLFPIPPEQRGQTKITISSYYVMYLRLKMQDENKLGQWDQHFKVNIPYQSGSYEFNFFDFDSYTQKTYEVNKHWKPQKHPTKMYTFRVR